MGNVNETNLPGVGIRFDFTTREGDRVVVVNHRSGRSELLVCSKQDPDACHEVLRLSKEDAARSPRSSGSHRSPRKSCRCACRRRASPSIGCRCQDPHCVGRTVYDIEHLDEWAASIAAVIRGETTIPTPPSTFTLEAEDVAVVIGTPKGVEAMATLLRSF